MPTACDCIEQFNKILKPKNARIEQAFSCFPKVELTGALISVEKLGRGKRPPLVVASFCPFCGTKYPVLTAASPTPSATPDTGAPR